MTDAVSGIVLAGGRSRRMGENKAFLLLDGRPIIAHVLEALRPVVQELLVVTDNARPFEHFAATVVEDLWPGAHALGGLYTGLLLAAHETCFVTGCDAPFLNPTLVQLLLREPGDWDAVIPRTQHGLQPLHAVYRRTCLPALEAQLGKGQWNLQGLTGKVRAKIVEPEILHRADPEERSFWNLNTPEDYAAASWIVHVMT